MPSAVLKKAVKDGLISQKQYDKMPAKMLEGLVAKKKKATKKPNEGKATTKKGGARKGQPKGARLAYDAVKPRSGKKGGGGKKGGKK